MTSKNNKTLLQYFTTSINNYGVKRLQDLIHDKDKRKLHILEYLFKETSPVPIRHLAEKTRSSVRTIKYDLEELKHELDDVKGAIISTPEGILLELPLHIGLDYFQQKVYQNTSSLTFIESLFFRDTLSVAEAEQLLYMSVSSLHRLSERVKSVLNEYGLDLLMMPFRITGNETVIRIFFTSYFTQKYHKEEWLFNQIKRPIIDTLIHHTIDYYHIGRNMFDYQQYRIRLAVDMHRQQNGHFTEIEKEWFETPKIQQITQKFSDTMKQELVSFELSDEEIARYLAPIRISFIDNEHAKRVNPNDIRELITALSQTFQLEDNDHHYLIFEINHLLNLYAHTPTETRNSHFLLHKPRDYFLLAKYEKDYTLFYRIAEQLLKKICMRRQIEPEKHIYTHLLYVLLSRWENLTSQLYYNYRSCSILVYSHYNLNHAANIAKEIASELDLSVSVKAYDQFTISEAQLAHYAFDILLTTTTLDLDIEQPIVYLHRKDMKLALEDVYELVDKISSLYTENTLNEIGLT